MLDSAIKATNLIHTSRQIERCKTYVCIAGIIFLVLFGLDIYFGDDFDLIKIEKENENV